MRGGYDVKIVDLLRELNELDEHTRIEAKTSEEVGKSLMETVSAFSNEPRMGGGYILIGVAQAADTLWPTYVPVGIDDPDKLQRDIST